VVLISALAFLGRWEMKGTVFGHRGGGRSGLGVGRWCGVKVVIVVVVVGGRENSILARSLRCRWHKRKVLGFQEEARFTFSF